MRRAFLIVGVFAFVAAVAPDLAEAQCAMCRTALESPEAQDLASAFRRAVLLLLAAPFTFLGVIAALVYRRSRSS